MTYLDLTHPFTQNLPVYPGDAKPKLWPVATLEANGQTDFKVETSMHVGTHIDGPLHMIPGGKLLSAFPAETFFGRAVIVDALGKEELGEDLLNGVNIQTGDIILFCTNWSGAYGEDHYYLDYPVMTKNLAIKLAQLKVKIIGLDAPSPDQPPFEVHKILLGHNILIIENLTNLQNLIGIDNVELVALPFKSATDSAPVRVVAKY